MARLRGNDRRRFSVELADEVAILLLLFVNVNIHNDMTDDSSVVTYIIMQ